MVLPVPNKPKTGRINLNRIGKIWGTVEALLLLPVLAVFMTSTDEIFIKLLMHFTGDFREFFGDLLILKMFSCVLLMALGCALVRCWLIVLASELCSDQIIGF